MLTKENKVKVRGDYRRSWMSDDYLDLIVWYEPSNAIHGFSSFVCCLILVVTLHPIHREIEMILVTTFKRACASLTRSRTPLRA